MIDKKDYNAFSIDDRRGSIKCKVCGVKYIATEFWSIWEVDEFIESIVGLPLKKIDNIVDHGKRLGCGSFGTVVQRQAMTLLRSAIAGHL
jgi:hypothetical protein